ncbi:MAG: VCBS repeat-containing protein [Candidatus Omnitrophica bacterium]|nr:VCBS repeat-containing protein [Candidatus Omnitrophota bacterium]
MLRTNPQKFSVLFLALILSILILSYDSQAASKSTVTSQPKGAVGVPQSDPDFTMVVLPDTQYEVDWEAKKTSTIWTTMTDWIKADPLKLNIKVVIGVGDITDQHDKSEIDFITAQQGFNKILSASIPYVPTIGNHDYDDAYNRVATTYDKYFGPAQLSKSEKQWYGGCYNGSDQNFYMKFDIGTHKYLVLALEFFPSAKALSWAQGILDANANADREVIVTTHAYLNQNGERQGNEGLGALNYYKGKIEQTDFNNGPEMWDAFIKKNKNIIMTLNGHFTDTITTAKRTDAGTYGNLIHQIFVDYQYRNLGDGYMMLLKFQPSSNNIQVSFYSPYLGIYDPKNKTYDLPYNMPNGSTPNQFKTSPVSDSVLMDINNDGQKELTFIKNGQMNAYDSKGSSLSGFPWNTRFNTTSPAIVDLNGDGNKEIIGGCDKGLCVYDTNGMMVSGWPKIISGTNISAPAVADLDKDGRKEIVIEAAAYTGAPSTNLYVFHSDGTLMEGWPKSVDGGVATNPIIADLYGNGSLDIIAATLNGPIYVWDINGNALEGWARRLPKIKLDYNAIFKTSPAVADLNNDGKKEIVLCDNNGMVYVFKPNGEILSSNWPKQISAGTELTAPSIGDINNDGKLEIALGSSNGKVYLLNNDGSNVTGWPQTTQGPIYAAPVLADVDNDGKLEIAVGSTDKKIYIWKNNGSPLSGWPKITNNSFLTPLVLGDFDNDGILNLIAVTDAQVYSWKLTCTKNLPWSIPRYDFQRTGFYSYKNNDAEIIIYQQPNSVKLGNSVTVKVKVTNNGLDTWKSGYDVSTGNFNNKAYDCRAHLYNANSKLLTWDLFMTGNDFTKPNDGKYIKDTKKYPFIPADVKPGETNWMIFTIPTGKNTSITKPGTYKLGVDLVQETVAWFGQEIKSLTFKVE